MQENLSSSKLNQVNRNLNNAYLGALNHNGVTD